MTSRRDAQATGARRSWVRLATAVLAGGLAGGVPLAPVLPQRPAGAATAQGEAVCPLPDRLVQVDATPWAQTWLGYEDLWRFTTGEGVTVAVVDTGVDGGHPQLVGKVLPGADVVDPLADRGVEGGTTADDLPGDVDCHGHGTFVAGIIAAGPSVDNPFAGVAPGVTILPIRQAHDDGDGTAGSMARAIILAVDAGATVINISSSVDRRATVLEDAVTYALDHDVVIVASVSNDGTSANRSTSYPAALPGVLSVGSIDITGIRSSTSEVGSGLDLMAPGQQVTSTVANSAGLGVENGTSYATPFVAGTVALVRSRFRELTADQVIHRLVVTADYSGRNRPDDGYGWGILNPERALTAHLPEEGAAGATPVGIEVDPPPPSDDGGTRAAVAVGAVWGLVGIAALGAGVVRAGNRRAWRPAGSPIGEDHPGRGNL